MTFASLEKILVLLTAIAWGIFTLIPNSHSLMASWSWVFLWQIGLLFPVLWFFLLLWQEKIRPIGFYVDYLVAFATIGIIISSLFSPFHNQGRWYAWAAICLVLSLYSLVACLRSSADKYRAIIIHGYVSFAFIIISLSLWLTDTLLPELSRLNSLNQKYNLNLKFDFSVLELRNWAPIGHQNYVAGYLLLSLPLFVGLAILQRGWRRYFWLSGLFLGLVDLYSTSSRGGWLGLAAICFASFAVLLLGSKLPRLWLGLAGAGVFSLLGTSVLANNRLNSIFSGGEFAYRWINANIGWKMGVSNLFTGVGLGGVPLVYQKYRPDWAGRESELAYQLHSTPVQLFAEMGIWGILAWMGAIILLVFLFYRVWRSNSNLIGENNEEARSIWQQNKTIDYCILAAFLGYIVISVTDYQLDNISISGTLVLFLACLSSLGNREKEDLGKKSLKRLLPTKLFSLPHKYIFIFLTATLLSILVWLYPIHRAWQISSEGFTALSEERIDTFVERLETAHKLAPWESYYPYQLGWNLGNFALTATNPQQQQLFWQKGIEWLTKANSISPYQEFGHSNLGWLLLGKNPEESTKSFIKAAELVPAKQGIYSNLAISLLLQGKTDLAVEAFALEIIRDPLLITSPIWQSKSLESIYPQIVDNLDRKYEDLKKKYPKNNYWRTCQISLAWWLGKIDTVKAQLPQYPNPLLETIIALEEGKNIDDRLHQMSESPAKLIITAWRDRASAALSDRQQRSQSIAKAWALSKKSEIDPSLLRQHLDTMDKSSNFALWLRVNAPSWNYRRERLGFGIVSRHLDGATPKDFSQVTENVAMETWFADLFPTVVYAPDIDIALKQWRLNLLAKLQ